MNRGVHTQHNTTAIHSREVDFHDGWATSTPAAQVNVRNCFESPVAMENQFILRHMNALAGKRVLDIGAGLGESSVYFALQGAQVTVLDISPEMVRKAQEVGRYHGVELEGRVSTGEDLPAPDETYDVVYIANTIHHVADRNRLFAELHRVLKPGGWFYSFDPIAYNPLINVYRHLATAVRSADETPLRRSDVKLAERYFPNVNTRMFWITTLLLFVKYFAVDRIHPNEDRYWKRILAETSASLWWWRPLRAIDAVLTNVPLVRWLSWNVVMWGQKSR